MQRHPGTWYGMEWFGRPEIHKQAGFICFSIQKETLKLKSESTAYLGDQVKERQHSRDRELSATKTLKKDIKG